MCVNAAEREASSHVFGKPGDAIFVDNIDREDLKKLGSLIKAYAAMGGKWIQFNVVGKKQLLEAQRFPERYRDLIVRVAGYSAYFTDLNKGVQDDIVRRTEVSI